MFYKKFFSLILTLGVVLCTVFVGGQSVFASANTIDEQDQVFLDFVIEDTGLTQVSYTSQTLYDAQLSPNGRQYVFTVGNTQGYALTARVQVNDQYFYEVEELFYNKPAPFANYQGTPVYVTFSTYLDCVDGTFYDLQNNRAVVSADAVSELCLKGFGYMGNSNLTYTDYSETINFATKNTQSFEFMYGAPNLYGSINGSCCANTAGAVAIAYYDRFLESLIPNYQTYIVFGGAIRYKSSGVELSNVVETLRDYMAVDGVQQGTTFSGFQQGMERYVEEKGYTYTTSSVMSWGELNFSAYQQAVEQDVPVAIFLNGFTMLNGINTSVENQETLSTSYCAATHVEIGIGYKIDTYYNANGGVVATRNYLRVVSGLNSYGIGYLNISSNANGQIVNAVAIDIN